MDKRLKALFSNVSIEYETDEDGSAMTCYTACLVGCIGAWRKDYPEVFAP